jgi:hypothetical protein
MVRIHRDTRDVSIIIPKSLIRSLPPEVKPLDVKLDLSESDNERRPSTPHLSFSQLSMYLRCSMQYYFRYVVGLKERPKVSLSLGKGGHAALEWNTKVKLRTGADAPTDEVVQKASDVMDHYLTDLPPSEIEKDVEPGGHKDKLLQATRIYRMRDAPAIRPISAEVEFNLDMNLLQPEGSEPLTEPIRIVNGKIDVLYDDYETRVVSHPDAIRVGVEDYKYVTRKKTQTEVNISPQITLYVAWLKTITGKWPTKAGLRMMHPGTKENPPDSIVLNREAEHMTGAALTRRLARLAYQFRTAERGIRAGIYLPTDDPITCSWCGFRERCQNSLVDDFEAATIREKTSTSN